MKKLIFILSALAIGTSFTSCDSNDDSTSNGGYSYRVKMTDAPGPYDEVNIDLQAVIVTDDNGNSTTLNTTAGMYNLLDYSNGLNVAIANGNLSSDNIQSIRLVLGNDNNVVLNGTTHALTTLNNEQGGLVINVNQDLSASSQNEVLLDFDAHNSIIESGSGASTTFRLRPVIRTVDSETSGQISGTIAANVLLNNFFMVNATSSTNVDYSSSVNSNGQFMISGLPAGTYTLTATSRFSFLPTIMTNVNVQAGATTSVGQVDFTN